jgi:hypothetical protein
MTIRPACAMNAEKLPTLPPTTMSAPLSEMPQRRDASPSMISKPPWADAPAAVEAKPRTCTRPDIIFSAAPGPALPCTVTEACLFMPAT